MNYAKIVDSALQLFPKKIKVTLIYSATGKEIGKYKIDLTKLPVAFNKPTTLEIERTAWRIIKADPVLADDFSFKKKLTLHVLEATSYQSPGELFTVPTLPDELPALSDTPLFSDFFIDKNTESWNQVEFLPLNLLPVVQEEISKIEIILNENETNALLGYVNQHIRKVINRHNLSIPFDEFCASMRYEKGGIRFYDNGFVQNGFALRSDANIWYGTVQNNIIKELCLQQYDFLDDELFTALGKYDLLLVDWCTGKILVIEDDNSENEIIF